MISPLGGSVPNNETSEFSVQKEDISIKVMLGHSEILNLLTLEN